MCRDSQDIEPESFAKDPQQGDETPRTEKPPSPDAAKAPPQAAKPLSPSGTKSSPNPA
jgi:hypothetical protein